MSESSSQFREIAQIGETFILLLFNTLRLQKATEENGLGGVGGGGGNDSGWISGEDLNTDGEESFGRKEEAAADLEWESRQIYAQGFAKKRWCQVARNFHPCQTGA